MKITSKKLRNFLLIVGAILLIPAPRAHAQTIYERLENRVMDSVNQFRSDPKSLNPNSVQSLIDSLENYTPQEAIERFTIPYYSGYLHYILALRQNSAATLDRARQKFEDAYQSYDDAIQLPERKVFARYVKGWCTLRKFLLSPNLNAVNHLVSAHDEFEDVRKENHATKLRNDIHFLKGLCNFLFCYEKFKNRDIDESKLESAIADFERVPEGQGDLSHLSQFYAAAARYLRAQYRILTYLLQGQPIPTDTRSDLESAQKIFNKLTAENNWKSPAILADDLSRLQAATLSASPPRPENLILSGMTGELINLLTEYAYALNFFRTDENLGDASGAGAESERIFWKDLKSYLLFLANSTPPPAFQNVQVSDWRSPYLSATAAFYRREIAVLNNRTPDSSPDSLLLMPFHRERNWFLEIYSRLKNELRRSETGYELSRFSGSDGVRELVGDEFIMNQVNQFYRNNFQNNNDRVFRFANYLLTLAEKNDRLYPVAYLSYEYLRRRNYQPQEMTLLKAYCEYQFGDYNQVTTLLSDAVIGGFDAPMKNEAIYYRAMAYHKISEWSNQMIADLERIKNSHPYAGYKLGWERDVNDPDCNLLNQVYTQSRGDARFAKITKACEDIVQQGRCTFTLVSTPPAIIVGDDDVRFEYLNESLDRFRAAERQFLSHLWQVFSLPILRPMPGLDVAKNCPILGPKEFDLEQEINVHLVLGHDGYPKQVVMFSENTGRLIDTTITEARLRVPALALRPYTIMVGIKGYFPAVIETSFKRNEETITVPYNEAKLVSRDGASEVRGLTVDKAGGFYLASRNGESGVRIYDGGGGPLSDSEGNYHAMTAIGENYYVVDRSLNKIRVFNKDRKKLEELPNFDESLLHRPSDIAAINNELFIANSGNNSVVKYNVENGATQTYKLNGLGKIEGLAVLPGKVFLTDWLNNSIYSSNQDFSEIKEFPCIEQARDDGMIAPGRISVVDDNHIIVSDVLANKLFLFHRSGVLIEAFALASEVYLPSIVTMTTTKLSVCHGAGVSEYPLQPNTTFSKELPRCKNGDPDAPRRTSSVSGASRFCF